MKFKKMLILVLIVVLFTSCNNTAKQSTEMPVEELEVISEENSLDVAESEEEIFNLSLLDSVDLDGNKVDASIFKNKMTLVNIWGTFCPPCIAEMPDLQKIHEQLGGEDFQVIGIISDTYVESDKNIAEAKGIVDQTGVKYINIIPDDHILNEVMSKIQFVPTTIIVDSEGKYMGEMVYGARDYNFFESWINSVK